MSNCVFGFPEFSRSTPLRTVTVDGSFGVAGLPKSNVIDPRLSRITRSADAAAVDTILDIDLGAACGVGLLSVLIPNLTKSSTPTVRWQGGTTVTGSDVYDSGAQQAWPTGVTAEDVIQPDGSFMNVWSTVIPTTTKTARYWRMAITDTGNADGYVDVARVVIAGAYRPSACMQTGAKSQLEDDTVSTPTDGGATLFQAKAQRRTDIFTLPNVGRVEALESIRRMQRRVGKSGQVFFVWDETDPYKYERAYLANMRELGALEYSFSALYSSEAFEMAEVL